MKIVDFRFCGLALRLPSIAARFNRDAKGVAAVEFAFIAPMLILLFVGTIEVSAAVSTNRKLSRLSSTLSDLVTQSQTLTCNDVNKIMDASVKVMYPYTDQVSIVISSVRIESGNATVEWSRSRNGTALTAGSNYTVPAGIMKDGTRLVTARVGTSYTPSFGWPTLNGFALNFSRASIPMDEEIFLRPRIGGSVGLSC